MLILIAVLIAGACIGVLWGAAQVPRPRIGATISAGVLAVLCVTALGLSRQADLVGGLLFVLTALSASVLSAARAWHAVLDDTPGYWWIVLQEVIHPGYVRRSFESRAAIADKAAQDAP